MGGLLSGCQDGPPLSLWCRHAQSFPPPSPAQPSPVQHSPVQHGTARPAQLPLSANTCVTFLKLSCASNPPPASSSPSVCPRQSPSELEPACVSPPPTPPPSLLCVSVQEREAEETKKSNCLLAPNSPRRSLQPGCLHPHPGGGRWGERGGGGGEDAGKAENWEVRVEGGHWR